MVRKHILVGTIDNAKTLCHVAEHTDCEIDLASGRYIVNAKSIMGIFSLDLSKPIEVLIHTEDTELVNDFLAKLGNIVQ